MTALASLDAPVREWTTGRNWWIRAPLLLWLAWVEALADMGVPGPVADTDRPSTLRSQERHG